VSEAGQSSAPPEKPGRYNRSFGGLIGSMIVAVLVVLGFVGFRGAFRDTPEVEIEPVDYLPQVEALQDAGRVIAYPPTLPDGWEVTSSTVRPGSRPVWGLGVLTDDGRYVGVRQQDEDVDDLIEELVDENADEGEPASLDSTVAPATWETFSDEGGDHAFVTTVATDVGEETLVVYGSAPVADLETMVGLLTLDPVAP
jgi:hypothetical protein